MESLYRIAEILQSVDVLPLVLKVTLVGLIGRCGMEAIRGSSAAVRYAVGVTTLVSMALVPLVGPAGLEWRIEVPVAERAVAAPLEAKSGRDAEEPGFKTVIAELLPAPVARSVTFLQHLRANWMGWALVLYAMVTLGFFARLLAGITGVLTILREAAPLPDGPARNEFLRAARRLGIVQPVCVLVSERVEVPVMWGITAPVLLLPVGATEWAVDRLRVVFLHELAHLARRDVLTLLLSRIAGALYWFHPVAWSLDREARRACEQACDDLVLGAGTRPTDYAGHLLAIASDLPQAEAIGAVTVAITRRSELEGRLLAILKDRGSRGRASARAILVTAAASALIVCLVGAAQIVARPAEGEDARNRTGIGTDLVRKRSAHSAGSPEEREVGIPLDDLIAARVKRGVEKGVAEGVDAASGSGATAGASGGMTGGTSGGVEEGMGDGVKAGMEARKQTAMTLAREGASLLEEREARAAIGPLTRSLELEPMQSSARYDLARALALNGDRYRAFEELQRAVIDGYSNGEHIRKDGDLASLRGTELNRLAKLAGDLAIAQRSADGDWKASVPHYERLVREHPEIPRAWFSLGFVLISAGEDRRGIEVFQQVLQMGHREAVTMYNLACAYAHLGERENALQWLRRSADKGFAVGAYAPSDKDLAALLDDPWLRSQIESYKGSEAAREAKKKYESEQKMSQWGKREKK